MAFRQNSISKDDRPLLFSFQASPTWRFTGHCLGTSFFLDIHKWLDRSHPPMQMLILLFFRWSWKIVWPISNFCILLSSSSSLLQSTLNSIVTCSSTWQMIKWLFLFQSALFCTFPILKLVSQGSITLAIQVSLPPVTTFTFNALVFYYSLNRRQTHFLCSHPFLSQKAYSKSILLSCCFLSRNPKLLTTAFTSYVRPLLEYSLSVSLFD